MERRSNGIVHEEVPIYIDNQEESEESRDAQAASSGELSSRRSKKAFLL
jgi:hypothetical protein